MMIANERAARAQAKTSDEAVQRVNEADGRKHEVQEPSGGDDQHDHARGAHGPVNRLGQHRQREAAVERREAQGRNHAKRGGFGRSRKSRIDAADHDEEDARAAAAAQRGYVNRSFQLARMARPRHAGRTRQQITIVAMKISPSTMPGTKPAK